MMQPGRSLPDFALPDHAGNPRRLSELVAGDPTIVHFYRGWWCPKEQAFLRRLVALQDEVEVAYSRVVSVTVDPPETAAAFRAGLGARWTFLSDAGRTVQAELGLRETTDTVHDPYVPAVFTLFPDLTVHRSYDGYWFWGRPPHEELRRDMRTSPGRSAPTGRRRRDELVLARTSLERDPRADAAAAPPHGGRRGGGLAAGLAAARAPDPRRRAGSTRGSSTRRRRRPGCRSCARRRVSACRSTTWRSSTPAVACSRASRWTR